MTAISVLVRPHATPLHFQVIKCDDYV